MFSVGVREIKSTFAGSMACPSQPSSTIEPVVYIEAGVGPPAVGLGVELERRRRHNMNWAKIILPSCLTAAKYVTLVYVQVYANFPTAFHFLNLAIILAFASFFIGWFINPMKYMVAAKVVVYCGVFFTYTAFFIGVTIPVPSSLKITGWLIYAISLLEVSLSFKTELKEYYDQAILRLQIPQNYKKTLPTPHQHAELRLDRDTMECSGILTHNRM